MMAAKTLPLTVSVLVLLLQFYSSASQTVVKAAYWFPASEFPISSINATLFTHLFCAFADIDPTTYQVTISSSNSAQFSSFTPTVRRSNPMVKTILSVGGGTSNPSIFSSMAKQSNTRKSFINSSIKIARSYNFNGLDLDWEYPSTNTDMTNLGLLLNEWRAAVVTESKNSGNPPLLLAAAFFYSSNYYSLNYPIQAISNGLDWINVMAYDFYGPGWPPSVTGPPAALYNPASQVSGDSGMKAWIQSGLSAKKIVLGFPYYGYAWRLVNSNNHGLFAPANGAAISADGSIGYNEIRSFVTQNGAQTVFNSSVVTDYCYVGTTWIGYDDTRSISAKVAYAKGKGLLGYFAWHVGADNNWVLSQSAFRAWGA